MQFTDYLGLLGGLALFLFGITLMGDGLELLAGAKLKTILERLTRNRFLAFLVGMVMTAVVQSSNAVTAMTVNFVNVGLMDFSRAIGVIMGSNIGTTITGQLIALNFSAIAPAIAFAGAIPFLFLKKNQKVHYTGQVFLGLGILFMGMSTMSSSMSPLKDVPWFTDAMTNFSNPFIGVAVGAIFTLLIQSSSASVGVLQALASQGLIGLNSAIFVICGQNIGCTIAAVMAAAGGTKNAKRTALVHILFNVTGTLIFIFAAHFTPIVPWIESWTPGMGIAQIANAHTTFNVVTTAVLLPCAGLLQKLACVLIPGDDTPGGPQLIHITPALPIGFGASVLALEQVEAELKRMHALVQENIRHALNALLDAHVADIKSIYENEEIIDFLNKEITKALVRVNALELSARDAKRMSATYHVLSDLERIGDHAENIAEYTEKIRSAGTAFSENATRDLRELADMLFRIVDESFAYFLDAAAGSMASINSLEEEIDARVAKAQLSHIDRLQGQRCTAEIGMIFVEVLTDIERAGDHALNIAEAAVN